MAHKFEKQLNIVFFSLIIILVIVAYIIGLREERPKSENEILLEYKVNEISKENLRQSEKFKFTEDSLKIYYSGIDKANQRTNYSINKIIKQNEKNKTNLLYMSDSTKLHIIDSMLRSAGYR